MSLRRRQVLPGVSQRSDFALQIHSTALLVIDIQRYLDYADFEYFVEISLPRAKSNITQLLHRVRSLRDRGNNNTSQQVSGHSSTTNTGCEVIWTFLQSATKDRRDVSLDNKLTSPILANIPHVYTENLFCTDCQPDVDTGKGDLLLPKTSSSVFMSTHLDYLLRNLNIDQLIVVGQLTDQSVESAVRDAAALGYFVTVVEDACAAYSQDRHRQSLDRMESMARILSTKQVLLELTTDAQRRSPTLDASMLDLNTTVAVSSQEKVAAFLRNKGFAEAAESLSELFANADDNTSSKSNDSGYWL